MKVNLVNSSLVFKTATIIEKTVTKTFSAGDVGSKAVVDLFIDKPIAANVPFNITITGDSVVSQDRWNLSIDKTSIGIVEGLVEDEEHTLQYPVLSSISLSRDSLANAGTVTFKVTYAYVEKEYPTIEDTLTLSNGVGNVIFTLPNAINAPCYFKLLGGTRTGAIDNSTNFIIHFFDSNMNEIGTSVQKAIGTTLVLVQCDATTPVKYVKIDRGNLSAITGTINITLYYFPDDV